MEKKDWFDDCYFYSWEEIMCCEDEHIWRIRMGDGTYIEIQVGGYSERSYLADSREESSFDMSLYNDDQYDFVNRVRSFIPKGIFDNGPLEDVPYDDCIKIIEKQKKECGLI